MPHVSPPLFLDSDTGAARMTKRVNRTTIARKHRSARVPRTAAHAVTVPDELIYEALAALAEALELLSHCLHSYPAITPPDAERLRRLNEHASTLLADVKACGSSRPQ
jgi:hypothetical protein